MTITDIGPRPQAFNLEQATRENRYYRTVAWSGRHLQVTLMSIPAGILADCLPRAKLLLGAEGLRAGFARYFVLAVIGRVEFAVAGNTRIFRRVRHGGL